VKEINHQTDQKRDEIQQRKYEAELIRLKTARRMAKQKVLEDRQRLINSLANKYRNAIIREEDQTEREKQARRDADKAVIVANIRNFYRDKGELLREELQSRKAQEQSWAAEQRKAQSGARKQRKQAKSSQLQALHAALERNKERAALDLKQVEAQLIALYKRA